MPENDHLTPSENLASGPIGQQLRHIAIPTSVGFFFYTMYNVVDTYFAGTLSTEALAALSLSFPVFFIIIAMGVGTGTGATALISNALGEGDREKARLYAAQALTYSVLISFLVTALGLAYAPHLFRILGAEETYLERTLSYMNVIILGSMSFIITNNVNAVLNATGNTKPYRNFLISAFFLNLVLDPWFLYGGFGLPAMGLQGIAAATIIIQTLGCIYLIHQATKTGLLNLRCLMLMRPQARPFFELSQQGIPSSLNMMTVAIGIFVTTYFVSWFGEEAVAAFGVATRIEQIALLPMIGLNVATLSIVGQSSGAKEHQRIWDTWGIALKYGFIILTPGVIGIPLFAENVMRFFSDDPKVISIGVPYLYIEALTFWAYTILYISVALLQGLKKPIFSVYIGVFRQFIAPISLIYLLVVALDYGIYGIWYSVFLSTWLAAIITIFYTRSTLRKMERLVFQ